MNRRFTAITFSLLMIGAVLSPVVKNWQARPQDSFPLSHYPMFSKKRSDTVGVTYLVGFDADGNRHKISYRLAGLGGLNQVRKQIRKFIMKGEASKLCDSVASKIAWIKTAPHADIVTIRISTGKYNLNDYFTGRKDPLSERVHAECRVSREEV